MTKYKSVFNDMLKKHKELFIRFKITHDLYAGDPKTHKAEFNQQGKIIVEIIREYENLVCGKSENSGYGKFSSTLSDKFWGEVRKNYPRIDFVGIN